MHVSLPDDLKFKLKAFAKKRGESMGAITRVALTKFFQSENLDPHREAALRGAIDSRLNVPSGWNYSQLLATLYQYSIHFPDENARILWGPMVYRGNTNKTNREFLAEINKEAEKMFKAKENGNLE